MFQRLKALILNLLRIKFVRDTITLQAGKIVLTLVSVASFVFVVRGLGPEQYGVYQLVLTMHGLLLTFDLTGRSESTTTRLAEAIAAGDGAEVRNLMGYFMQMSLLVAVVACAVAFLFGAAFAEASYNNATIGELMKVYTLVLFLTPIYSLSLLTLQSTLAMRSYTFLENLTNVVESVLKIAVALLIGSASAMVAVYLLSSVIRAALGLRMYGRVRRRQPHLFPGMGGVLSAAWQVSPRRYWQFGFALALDKNLSQLFTLLPVQLLGMWGGEAAAGFLKLGISAMQYPTLLLSGVLTNLTTRLPADVGQQDYVRLRRNFGRVFRWMAGITVAMYGLLALFAPVAVPILGEEYTPAINVIRVLCVYGVITGLGGIFGPLYRTLRQMRAVLVVKGVALAGAALPAVWLIQYFLGKGAEGSEDLLALGGAWSINLVFALSVALTIAVVWPRLNQLAKAQQAGDLSSATTKD
jgi:O-antigen/teichoic acid export membrane protein